MHFPLDELHGVLDALSRGNRQPDGGSGLAAVVVRERIGAGFALRVDPDAGGVWVEIAAMRRRSSGVWAGITNDRWRDIRDIDIPSVDAPLTDLISRTIRRGNLFGILQYLYLGSLPVADVVRDSPLADTHDTIGMWAISGFANANVAAISVQDEAGLTDVVPAGALHAFIAIAVADDQNSIVLSAREQGSQDYGNVIRKSDRR
jgi:hypothetical protein